MMSRMTTDSTSWEQVAAKLAASRNYWIVTVGADGSPHATPVWGVVIDSVLHLYSGRQTVKAKNLALNPRLIVHLESAEDVVIVRGTAEDLGKPADVPHVVAALSAKYDEPGDADYLPSADPSYDVVYAMHPESASMWLLDDFDASQRRWHATT